MVVKWTLTDSIGTFTFKVNPTNMSTPLLPRDLTVTPGSFGTTMQPRKGIQFTAEGNIYSLTERNLMLAVHDRDTSKILTDHLGRQFLVISEQLSITDRRPSGSNANRFQYNWSFILLGDYVAESS